MSTKSFAIYAVNAGAQNKRDVTHSHIYVVNIIQLYSYVLDFLVDLVYGTAHPIIIQAKDG